MFILVELPDKKHPLGKRMHMYCNINGGAYSSWEDFWRNREYPRPQNESQTDYGTIYPQFVEFLKSRGYVEVGYQYFMIPEEVTNEN